MNTYELFFIFKPFVDADQNDAPIKILETLTKSASGKIKRTDKIGRKRLGYELNGFKDGFLMTALVDMKPDQLKEFLRQVKLSEEILRLTTLKMNEKTLKAQAARVREREQRMPARGRA